MKGLNEGSKFIRPPVIKTGTHTLEIGQKTCFKKKLYCQLLGK